MGLPTPSTKLPARQRQRLRLEAERQRQRQEAGQQEQRRDHAQDPPGCSRPAGPSRSRPSPSPTRPPPKCASARPAWSAQGAKDGLICTFHALGVRLLREDGAALGLKPQFSILDSDDISILKDAGGTTDTATARQRWQWTISLWKNQGLNRRPGPRRQRTTERARGAAMMARSYEERLAPTRRWTSTT